MRRSGSRRVPFPNDVFVLLAQRGYLGLRFPPEYCGGGDPVADAVLAEELAKCGSGGLAAAGRTPGSRCHRSGSSGPITAVRTGGDRHQGVSLALISFDDVFVLEEQRLGEEGAGFYLIMANFAWERLIQALGAIGGMQSAFEKTLPFVLERSDSTAGQAIRHQLAAIATTIEYGRSVTYSVLRTYLAGGDAVREVTIARLATQRAAFDVMDTCLQIHGHSGYLVDNDIERAARDAGLGSIGGGTDKIMREILGRSLGL